MSSALGALMQAPTMGAPRPAVAPIGAAPPPINTTGFVGTTSRQPGSFSPSDGGPGRYPVASAAFPTSLGATSPPPAASITPPLPAAASPPLTSPGSLTPPVAGAASSGASPAACSPLPPGPPAASGSNGVEERDGATPTSAGDAPSIPQAGCSPLPSPPGVAVHALPRAALQVHEGAGASGAATSPMVSPRGVGAVGRSAIDAGVAGLFVSEENSFGATPDVVVGTGEGGQASSPHPGGGKVFSGVPVHVPRPEETGTAAARAVTSPRQHADGVLAGKCVSSGGMVSVDLSSRLQDQAAFSIGPEVASNATFAGSPPPPPPAHPSSAPSSNQGRTAPPASRPQVCHACSAVKWLVFVLTFFFLPVRPLERIASAAAICRRATPVSIG